MMQTQMVAQAIRELREVQTLAKTAANNPATTNLEKYLSEGLIRLSAVVAFFIEEQIGMKLEAYEQLERLNMNERPILETR